MCLGMNPDILSPASAARRPRTATSRAARAPAGGRIPRPRDGRSRGHPGRFTDVRGTQVEELPGHSNAAVLDRADVDTDQIIPKQFLKRIERSGYGEFLFYDWMKDPAFELHRPEYQAPRSSSAGRNFGCGSSREHAAWALEDYGFRYPRAELSEDLPVERDEDRAGADRADRG